MFATPERTRRKRSSCFTVPNKLLRMDAKLVKEEDHPEDLSNKNRRHPLHVRLHPFLLLLLLMIKRRKGRDNNPMTTMTMMSPLQPKRAPSAGPSALPSPPQTPVDVNLNLIHSAIGIHQNKIWYVNTKVGEIGFVDLRIDLGPADVALLNFTPGTVIAKVTTTYGFRNYWPDVENAQAQDWQRLAACLKRDGNIRTVGDHSPLRLLHTPRIVIIHVS